MSGSTRDYHNGRKNNWRRWGWNRVLARTAGRERLFPILYLAGPQDLDRRVAMSKGVPPTNLIAIDRESRNISRVRRDGGVGIVAEVGEVLEAWPATRPVAAVVLDFCCGLEPSLFKLQGALLRQPFADAAVWLNIMRGRDPSSNDLRARLGARWIGQGVDPKNRAALYYSFVGFAAFNRALADTEAGVPHPSDHVILGMSGADLYTHVTRSVEAEFRSYRSGGLVFDSVIHWARQRQWRASRGLRDVEANIETNTHPDPDVRRLVSAALAVRTMRADR